MVAVQPREIQVAEDVAQQDELIEAHAFQHAQRIRRPACFRAQVQVGKNQRVAECLCHCPNCGALMLSRDEEQVKFWEQNPDG